MTEDSCLLGCDTVTR